MKNEPTKKALNSRSRAFLRQNKGGNKMKNTGYIQKVKSFCILIALGAITISCSRAPKLPSVGEKASLTASVSCGDKDTVKVEPIFFSEASQVLGEPEMSFEYDCQSRVVTGLVFPGAATVKGSFIQKGVIGEAFPSRSFDLGPEKTHEQASTKDHKVAMNFGDSIELTVFKEPYHYSVEIQLAAQKGGKSSQTVDVTFSYNFSQYKVIKTQAMAK